jgi:hypothetical protein
MLYKAFINNIKPSINYKLLVTYLQVLSYKVYMLIKKER